MRNRAIILSAALSIVVGLGALAFSKASPSREPANQKSSWRPLPLGKHLALFHVELKAEHEIPTSTEEEVTLTARVRVNQNLNSDLVYEWVLPEDVSVVEGNVSDTLSGVAMGQVVERSVTLTGFSKEKQSAVSFSAKAMAGTQMLGNSAVIVSRDEDTLEAVAPGMRRSAEAQLGEEVFRGRRK